MAKTTHGIRRFKVRYLIPDEESFKKIGFGFSKVDDGYEVYSLPSNWTKKRERPLRYIVEDDKGRFRATIGLSPDEPENSYIMLHSLFSIGVLANGDDCYCEVIITDLEHRISKEDYIHRTRFTFEKSEFEKARDDIFNLFNIWECDEIYRCLSDDDDTEVKTNLDVDKIRAGFQEAVDFLDAKFPGWKEDPTLYWD